MQAAAAGEGSHPSANVGLNRWFGVLRHLAIPPDSDAAAASLSLHLMDLEKGLQALMIALAKYVDVTAKISECLGEIKSLAAAVEATSFAGEGSLSASLPDTRERSRDFGNVMTKFGAWASSVLFL